MAKSRRDDLVEAALELFMQHGFHATGIDKLLAKSGVAKMTLYKHFKSKDELIIAALEKRSEDVLAMLRAQLDELSAKNHNATAEEKISAVFTALGKWFSSDSFYGCTFINAAGEYLDRTDPIHQSVCRHKLMKEQLLLSLLTDSGIHNAEELATQISLVIEGAIVKAHTTGNLNIIKLAEKTALSLLANSRS